jgi:hypothetical protein
MKLHLPEEKLQLMTEIAKKANNWNEQQATMYYCGLLAMKLEVLAMIDLYNETNLELT